MQMLARIVFGLIGLAAAGLALVFAVELAAGRPDFLLAVFMAVAGVIAFLGLWFAVRGGEPEVRAQMGTALKGGVILGILGFVGGFFGPMILTPDANQGPLLGIFITGPLGFVLGSVAGYIRARLF
jgi:hypothetical protein